jgi:fatty acid desaturase
MHNFASDPYYLLKYYCLNFAFYAAAISGLLALGRTVCWADHWPYLVLLPVLISSNFYLMSAAALGYLALAMFTHGSVSCWHALYVPAGAYLGCLSATLMHNAAHRNIRPRAINALIGELCGLQQLLGFRGWAITHQLHHQNPDDPELDPHPPLELSFRSYIAQMKYSMRRVITAYYERRFGSSDAVLRTWRITEYILVVNRFLRAVFLFLLLGPLLFALLFAPSLVSNILLYCDFNYFTHRPTVGGGYEIMNLNSKFRHRVLNQVVFGAYFHLNHHVRPSSFNPMKAGVSRRRDSGTLQLTVAREGA